MLLKMNQGSLPHKNEEPKLQLTHPWLQSVTSSKEGVKAGMNDFNTQYFNQLVNILYSRSTKLPTLITNQSSHN